MNNDAITPEQTSSDQHYHADSQQGGSSIQTQYDAAKFVNGSKKIKKLSMIPTPLYASFCLSDIVVCMKNVFFWEYFWCSTHST